MESSVKQRIPKILASGANGVIEMIDYLGGDLDSILGTANIRPKQLSSPLTELELKKFCNLYELAACKTHNYNFGLSVGASFQPNMLGLLGYLVVNSPTLLSAINNLINYFPAHQDNSSLMLSTNKNLLQLNYEITDPSIVRKDQDAELSIGIFNNLFKYALGSKWSPLEVHFSHSCLSDNKEAYERVFGCPIKFNQPSNSIVFKPSDLERLMPNSDPFLFAVIEPQLLERKELRERPEELLQEVRQHIKILINDSVPSLSDVAESLSMTALELQKELKKHNLAFNDLVKAVRQDLAIKYVRNTDINMTDVAFSLGYSELSAFSRAFKSWTQMSPHKYRKVMKGE